MSLQGDAMGSLSENDEKGHRVIVALSWFSVTL